MEYNHGEAVADGVNVDFDVYRIRTEITEAGATVEAGLFVDRRDRETRRVRWEKLDEDLKYGATELDRSVVATDQIRTVVRTFRDRLFTDIFPGRTEVPKTLIYAKDDSHADDIVQIVREEFGNDYHGLNVVFEEAELRGLFDFDALNRGRYIEDIGYALFMFGREFRGSRKIRSNAARAFLDSYGATRPLSSGECEALPLLAPLGWVGRSAYYAMLRRDGDDALAHFRRHVDTMHSLLADRERIAKMIANG